MANGQDTTTTRNTDQLTQPVRGLDIPQNILPPSSPIDPLEAAAVKSSQMGQEAFATDTARRSQLAQELTQLRQQQAAIPIPKMGPQIEHGQGLFHNLGQALLMVAGMTSPGRALEQEIYGPGVRRYEAEAGTKARQIEEIQKQMGTEAEAQSAAASMTSRPMTGYGTVLRGQAAQTTAGANVMNAQTKALAEQHKAALQREANRIREEIGNGKLTAEAARTQMMGAIARERDQMMRDITSVHTSAEEAIAQQKIAGEEWKTETEHYVQSLFGWTPEKPVTPAGGGSPQKPHASNGGGTVQVTDPRGNIHTFRDQKSADAFKKAAGIR